MREQVRKKVSVRWDRRVISGWLGLGGEGGGTGLWPSRCSSPSECTVAGTVGPAWFSQPIVVIVTFEKDRLHPSGQKRLLEAGAGRLGIELHGSPMTTLLSLARLLTLPASGSSPVSRSHVHTCPKALYRPVGRLA